LVRNKIDPDSADALAKSQTLPRLKKLTVF